MPQFKDAFSTISITLPSYKDSKVEIKTNISMEDVQLSETKDNEIDKTLLLAEKMVNDWNFEDEKGEKIPVKAENIKKLPATDIKFIFETIKPYIEKKTLSEKTK